MNRRLLLTSALLLPFAGCATTSPTVVQLQQDANLIVAGLSGVLTAIAGMTTIPPVVVAQVQGYLVQAQAAAAAIVATSAPSASTVQQIVSAIQAVASVVLPLIPGAGPIAAIILAALSMIPALLAAVGMGAAAQADIGPGIPRPRYTTDQARLILKAGLR